VSNSPRLPDIKPQTAVARLDRERLMTQSFMLPIGIVAPAVGMSESFIRKVVGHRGLLSPNDVLNLLDQDAFSSTVVPRSRVLDFLLAQTSERGAGLVADVDVALSLNLIQGNALEVLGQLPSDSVRCIVTSTPYWGMRIYKDSQEVRWADGESSVFGHENTPESFVRHTAEVLLALKRVLREDGSIWWNVMDSFNTRTQIRGNAAEALRAMQGKDGRRWSEHECRRYSAGHAYLKDGEQCLIPSMIAERASRLGFYVKSVITWAKTSSMPEPQESRVSRNLEYILHLTKQRTPFFKKEIYRTLPPQLGGRNNGAETDKLSDVWSLPTSSGRDGHGAQFPVALPARCIALSSEPDDLVLDPFVGSGNSGLAALALGRRFIGIDISNEYLELAKVRLATMPAEPSLFSSQSEPTLPTNCSLPF